MGAVKRASSGRKRALRFESLERRELMAVVPGLNVSAGTHRTTYTLALAMTAELTANAGGSAPAATFLNQFVGALNNIFGREAAVQFQLHPRNNDLIFTDAASDGYTNGQNPVMINENPAVINRALNGNPANDAGYDFGHVLGLGNDGGLAGAGVKANGASNLFGANVTDSMVSLVAHELAHQFSVSHSFNGVLSNCNQRASGNAYEPGAGSSTMSYARSCAGDNLSEVPGDKAFFHAASFDELVSYATQQIPTRGVRTATGNQLPTVNAGPDRTIPAATPFRLSATSSDPDTADVLTFTWDQIDNGGAASETLLGTPLTVGGQPAAATHTLNQLEQTTAPYVPGDRIRITGTDVNGRTVNGTYTFAAGHTLADLLGGGFLDQSIRSSFYDATNTLTANVVLNHRGQIMLVANTGAPNAFALTLQSDPNDPTPQSGLTNFGAFTRVVNGRSDPGGVSVPIPNARDNLGPLFRSFAPSADPARTFPRLSDILANTPQATNKDEHLPTQSRDLNFRVTVRDNHRFENATISGVVSDDVKLTVVNTGAAFAVTSHNAASQTLQGGSRQTITWNVAGTTANGIDTSKVDILLSLDGGQTYPLALAQQTDNDGSQEIVLPNANVAAARIKVQADPAQNVFFDVNDASFRIDFSNAAPGILVAETGGNTRFSEGQFVSTGLSATDTYTIALSQAPASPVTITITADAQTQVSTDGTAFSGSQAVTFAAGETTAKTITVRAVNDTAAEGVHTGTIRHAVTASADPNYSPQAFPAGAVNSLVGQISDDESVPLIGLDFNLQDGDPSPPNWSASANPFTVAPTNMTREGGTPTNVDLAFVTTPGNFQASLGSTNIAPGTIPRHSPELSGLDGVGSFLGVTSVSALWSDLQPNAKYRVYVFAYGNNDLNQQVTITGNGVNSPAPFTQSGTGNADKLLVNGTPGSSTADLETLAAVVTSTADGKVTVRLDGSAVHLAGLAIQELLESPAGFTIAESGGRTEVTEAGSTDTFTVVLNKQPATNVTLNVVSPNTNEATVAPAAVTFTPANWNQSQTVTVTGVDDARIDGNQTTNVAVSIAAGSDAEYANVAAQTVAAVTTDNDVAGFTIVESDGKTEVTEAGTTDTFTVVLRAQPDSDVVLGVASANTNEATVSTAALTFTSGNWNQPQTVTVTGVDDQATDGDQITDITVSVTVAGTDPKFANVAAQVVKATTKDNDIAGFAIVESAGNTQVSEAGTTDTFTVVLSVQPTANVVLNVVSANTAEATVDAAKLTFTPGNWNQTQTVTVTGVDDMKVDGDQTTNVTVSLDAANSAAAFANVAAQTVRAVTADNDTASFTITETNGGTEVNETGTTDTFTVVLGAEPVANVVLRVVSGTTTEATVSPATLTFTPGNWNQTQTVTVTGVEDNRADGNQTVTITVSVDPASSAPFAALAAKTVSATVVDSGRTGPPWQNVARPTDVNGDGNLTPLDAITIITRLNQVGSGILPAPTPQFRPAPFYDVDGNGQLTPLDAVTVISALRAAQPQPHPGPEGEPAPPTRVAGESVAGTETMGAIVILAAREERNESSAVSPLASATDAPRRTLEAAGTAVPLASRLESVLDAIAQDIERARPWERIALDA